MFKMNKYKVSFLLFTVRIVDLISTHITVDDFMLEEQNVMVKIYGFTEFQYYFFEIIFAIFLISLYLYCHSLLDKVHLNYRNFIQFIKCLFLKNGSAYQQLNFATKRVLIVLGTAIPLIYITMGLIAIINNMFYYTYKQNINSTIAIYYDYYNDHLWEFLFLQFPIYLTIILFVVRVFSIYKAGKS